MAGAPHHCLLPTGAGVGAAQRDHARGGDGAAGRGGAPERAGHPPRRPGAGLLGEDDDRALTGFLARMEGMIALSRERGEKMRGPVAALSARVDQPLSLEAALETARVTADVLFTLGERARGAQGGATLRGKV